GVRFLQTHPGREQVPRYGPDRVQDGPVDGFADRGTVLNDRLDQLASQARRRRIVLDRRRVGHVLLLTSRCVPGGAWHSGWVTVGGLRRSLTAARRTSQQSEFAVIAEGRIDLLDVEAVADADILVAAVRRASDD